MIGSRIATSRPRFSAVPRAPGGGFVAPLHLLAVMAVVAAAWSSPEPGSQVAILVIGPVCLLLTAAWLALLPDDAARRDLPAIVLAALVLRLCVFAAIRHTVGPYVFAPDAWTYEMVGGDIVDAWHGLRELPARATGSLQVGYYYVNAGLAWVFGPSPGGPAVLNAFFGAWTTIPVYYLARCAVGGNRGVGRWAAGLTAVFPSLVLWSVLNLREAPTIFLLVCAVQAVGSWAGRTSPRGVGIAALCILGLATSRGYLALLVGTALPAGLLLARARSAAGGMVGGLILFGVIALAATSSAGASLAVEPTLETLEAMRRGLGEGAQTAYGAAFDVSTPGGAARFFPVGLAYYLLAPFPWDLGSTLQSVTILETLVWYALIPFILWGMALGLRHDRRSYLVLAAVLLAIVVPYALVQGNVGTAFRHRAQILPLVFVFASVGLRDAYGALMAQRRQQGQRRRDAARHLAGPSLERAPAAHGSS